MRGDTPVRSGRRFDARAPNRQTPGVRLVQWIVAEWASVEVRLALAWMGLVYAWSWFAAPDGYLLSFDDVWRLVHAHEASHGALTPSEVWPPLPFWLVGIMLRLGCSSTVAPQLLGIVVTGASLVQTWRLAGEMGLGQSGRAASAGALALSPALVWLAPSALVETWTLLTFSIALRAVRTWWVDLDATQLGTAFGALALGGMLRYESWGWSVMLIVACRAAIDEGRPVGRWRRGALVALAFPLAWCAYQFATTGNPFSFGEFAREFLAEDHPNAGPVSRVAEGTRALSQLAAPLAIAGGLGWLVGGRLRGGGVVGSVIVMVTTLQLVAHTMGFAGLHNVWRHYLPLALGLGLGAGMLVDRAARLGRAPALATFALIAQVEWLYYEWPASGYTDDVGRVARHIRRLRDELGGNVLIEGVGYDSRALQILIGDMDAAVFDRLIWLVPLDRPMTDHERTHNRSLLELSYAQVVEAFRNDDVRVIAVFTEQANVVARAFGTVEYAAGTVADGRWTVLRTTGIHAEGH